MSARNIEVPTGVNVSTPDPYRVESYPPPRENPLYYPGLRPDFSFTTMPDGQVRPISVQELPEGVRFTVHTAQGAEEDLDAMLSQYDLTSMAERVPVVGFGSNASPGQLPPIAERLISPDLSDQERAELLVDITRQRTAFVRRHSATYEHSPDDAEPEDMIFGDAVVRLLQMDRLTADASLLTTLPPEAIDVVPQPFGELYNK